MEKVNFVADAWVKELERLHPGIAEIRGPAPCPFERVQDQHRVHIWYFVHGVKSFLAAALPLRTKILGDDDVIDVLADLFTEHGPPEHIWSDNVLCWEAAAGFSQQISMRRQPSARHAF